jgi:hypothetical protein
MGSLDAPLFDWILSTLQKALGRRFPHSEWIYMQLVLVEALDGFNDLLPS